MHCRKLFWPGINADNLKTVYACEPCQRLQPSLQQEPLMLEDKPKRPFMSVLADFPFMKEWQTKAEDCDWRAAVWAKNMKTRYNI